MSSSTLPDAGADTPDDIAVVPAAVVPAKTPSRGAHARERVRTVNWALAFVIGIVVVVGLVERIILLRHNSLQPDSDESMSGLMAKNLLHGNPETFLWGQPYGGAAEVYPVALMIKIFGPTLFAMRAFTVALGAVVPFLMWRVSTRIMKPTAAICAGLTMWIWPVAFISWSLREYLYYEPVLTLGLLGILFSQRAVENTKRWGSAIGVGLCMGVGWWISPFIAYFGLFVVLTLVQNKTYLIKRSWITIIGFAVGALPWISYNVPRNFISLQRPSGATGGSYQSHLHYLAQPGLSLALGLKGWYSKIWLFNNNRTIGHLMLFGCCAVMALVGLWAFVKWARHQAKLPVDIICLVAWPLLYALSPMTGSPTVWVPRYFFFLWPFMAFVVGRLAFNRKLIPLVMTVITVMSSLALHDQVQRVNDWPYTGALRAELKANNVHYLFTSYWVAYKIDYEMNGAVTADPWFPASVRYQPYDQAVRAATNPAWAFRHGDNREARFIIDTTTMGLHLQPIRANAYDLFLMPITLHPEALPQDVLSDPAEGV